MSGFNVNRGLLGWLGVGAGVLVAVALVAPAVRSGPAPTGVWQRLPDPPLSPRTSAVGAWTGKELLAVGGFFDSCPPQADCFRPPDKSFADGAAFDPKTQQWRSIADAPRPFEYASTAVLENDVYFYASVGPVRHLWRYSVSSDTWAELPSPVQPEIAHYYGVVAADDSVLLVVGTHEHGTQPAPDLRLNPATGKWTALPVAPSGFSRGIAYVAGRLFLFDKELPYRSLPRPSLTRVFRLDAAGESWEQLPAVDMLGAPGIDMDGVLVNALLGGADGGEVNNWGRTYPYGGLFDVATATWRPLPYPPSDDEGTSAGVFGEVSAEYYGTRGGWLLDFEKRQWLRMPALDPAARNVSPENPVTYRTIAAAGRDAVAFFGVRWTGVGAVEPLKEAWIWRAPD